MEQLKFAKHVHHHLLFEPLVEPIEVRLKYIEKCKPKDEIPVRRRLLKEVDADLLPNEVVSVGRAYKDAWRAYKDAERAYGDAGRAYGDAGRAYKDAWRAYKDAERAYDDAWRAYDDARRAYSDAWRAYEGVLIKHATELEALHKQICVDDCPWDGKTIFPTGKD